MKKHCIYCGSEIPGNDRYCPQCGKPCRNEQNTLGVRVPIFAAVVGSLILMMLIGVVFAPRATQHNTVGTYSGRVKEVDVSLQLEDGTAVCINERGTFTGSYTSTSAEGVYEMTLNNEAGESLFLSIFGNENDLLVFEKTSSNTAVRYILKKDKG